jgi:hypothetical protein
MYSKYKGFKKIHNWSISQIWLNLFVDDCQFGYIRKLVKKNKKNKNKKIIKKKLVCQVIIGNFLFNVYFRCLYFIDNI